MSTSSALVYLLASIVGTGMLCVIARWRLRSRSLGVAARKGYSVVEKALAVGVCSVGWFGFTSLIRFGNATGGVRAALVAGACAVAVIGAALVWQRFGTALAWDSEGVTYFGAMRIVRCPWASVQRVRWDNRARVLVIEAERGSLKLPADLDGVRQLAGTVPSHLKSSS